MHTLTSFLVIFTLIFSYLVLYHKIELNNVLDVMHSAFTRQFIFELIPFIILFTTRELKFIDIENAPNFFNSVIGRSMIGMVAFTFATYTLSSVNPIKIGGIINNPLNSTLRLNSFTTKNISAPLASAPIAKQNISAPMTNQIGAAIDNQIGAMDNQIGAPMANQIGAPMADQLGGSDMPNREFLNLRNIDIEPNEKLLSYALI